MYRFLKISAIILTTICLFIPNYLQASTSQENDQCCVCICQFEPEPPLSCDSNENNPKIPLNLAINELFPDPKGLDTENEFIEVINNGSIEVNLKGWTIQVGSKKFKLEQNTYLPASNIKFWPYLETKLTLTNTGNTVRLIEPNGTEHEAITYPGPAKTGQTYAKNNIGQWQWTNLPTPGQINVFSAPEPDEPIELNPNQDNPLPQPEIEPIPEESATPNADLIINEFLPDPEGSDSAEWIELKNRGNSGANLIGWVLDDMDGGSRPFSLSDYHLESGGFLLINKSKSSIALNNGGDEVRLLNPNGNIVDSVQYQEAPTGKSFARDNESWYWSSEPTPGQANIPEVSQESDSSKPEESVDQTTEAGEENFEEQPEIIPLSELPDLEDGTLVTVEATVSLPLNLIGKTIFMVEDTYGSTGAEARLYGKDRPDFTPGQWVRLQGRVNQSDSGWRLNVLKDGLSILENIKPIESAVVAPIELSEDFNGMTVSVTGLVTAKNGRRLKLTDESGEPRIDVRLLGKDPVPGKIGDEVEAIGVVRWKNHEVEIIVSERSGLIIKKIAPEETDEPEEKRALGLGLTLPQTNNGTSNPGWPLALAGAATAGMITMAWLNWRRRQTESGG